MFSLRVFLFSPGEALTPPGASTIALVTQEAMRHVAELIDGFAESSQVFEFNGRDVQAAIGADLEEFGYAA